MKFGLCLPNYGPPASPQAVLQAAQAAELAGYDSVWVTDHILAPAQYHDPYGMMLEALITLGYLAGVTQKITLASSIIVLPQREPVLVARQVAAIDQFSNGRMLLGVGVGWMADEFRFLRADFKNRGRMADEWIAVMRTLWAEEQPAFAGQWVNFDHAKFEPKPAQPNGVPIHIGGKSEAAIRRAARLGDGWHPTNYTPEQLAAGLKKLREWSNDRPLEISMRGNTAVDRSGRKPNDSSPWPFSGTPAEVIDRIGVYADAGMEHLVCYFNHQTAADILNQLELFAAEVMPAFR